MSDTPRTADFYRQIPGVSDHNDCIRHAVALERENAALRGLLQRARCCANGTPLGLKREIDAALANSPTSDYSCPKCAATLALCESKLLDRDDLKARLTAMFPLFEEARDALPAIPLASAKLRGVSLDLADRMDAVGDPAKWATHPANPRHARGHGQCPHRPKCRCGYFCTAREALEPNPPQEGRPA